MTSQMFDCQSRPAVPNGMASDADFARFIVRQALAHEDCEAQLSTVKNHLLINGVAITNNLPQEAVSSSKFLGLF